MRTPVISETMPREDRDAERAAERRAVGAAAQEARADDDVGAALASAAIRRSISSAGCWPSPSTWIAMS